MRGVIIFFFPLWLLATDAFLYSIQDLAHAVSETNQVNIVIDPSIDITNNFFFSAPLDSKLSLNAFRVLLQNNGYDLLYLGTIYYVNKHKDALRYGYHDNPNIPKEHLQEIAQYFGVQLAFFDASRIVVGYSDTDKYKYFMEFLKQYKQVRHVYLEGEILSVNETHLKDIGIDFASIASAIHNTGSFSLGLISNINENDAVKEILNTRSLNGIGDVSLFLSLLKQVGNAKVVTRPNLLVRSGEKSVFKSGKQIRIITGSTDSIRDGGEYTSRQYEMLDAGLNLTCKADIVDDNINLDFDFAVKDVSTYNPELEQLIIENRSYQSRFSIKDGDTVVLAGLTSQTLQQKTSHVPLLSDIPIVGTLFDHDFESSESVSYLIYLKASIQ